MPDADPNIHTALWFACLAGALGATACPLSDDYFADANFGAGRGAVASGNPAAAGARAGGLGSSAAMTGAGGTLLANAGGRGAAAGASGEAATAAASGLTGNGGAGGTGAGGGATGGLNTGGSNLGGLATGSTSTGGNGWGGTNTGGASTCTAATCSGTCCGNACVNLASDPSHCGDCDVACNVGRSCSNSQCTGGWLPMAAPPSGFVGRQKAAYTSFDNKLFVFGGQDANGNALGDAASYDPATNTWTLVTAIANAPSPRRLAMAVWTGTQLLVVGGRADYSGTGFLDGASYDPSSGQWSPIRDELVGRVGAVGCASSSQAVFWQGWGATGTSLVAGAERYTVATDSWQVASTLLSSPGTLMDPAWAFTGTNLYLFGGLLGGTTRTDQAWSYSLTTNSWSTLTTTGTAARSGSFGAWDTHSFFVWAGRDATGLRNDGWYYYGGVWSAMGGTGAPPARVAAYLQAGWAFVIEAGNIVFLGGLDANGNALTDGSRYYSAPISGGATWTPIGDWPSGEQHLWAAGAYVGGEIVIWGGANGTEVTATGDRWAP